MTSWPACWFILGSLILAANSFYLPNNIMVHERIRKESFENFRPCATPTDNAAEMAPSVSTAARTNKKVKGVVKSRVVKSTGTDRPSTAAKKETKTTNASKRTKTTVVRQNAKKATKSSSDTATLTTPKKKRKLNKEQQMMHWKNASDPNILHIDKGASDYNSRASVIEKIQWVVRGNPLPLRRHRTSRGFVYNPSAPAQASFLNITTQILEEIVPSHLKNKIDISNTSNLYPLFPENQPLVMVVLFRLKRPNLHFVGNKPGHGRLRDSAPSALSPTRTDVDNLAKFVLDSLNGILYEDDRQIHSLYVTKLLDNDGLCQGSTEISCRPLCETDVNTLVNKIVKR